jgi:hypothetical protein
VSGDGCSGDCSMIEAGYSCPVWGESCVKLCGNGVIDEPYVVGYDEASEPIMFQEECDLAALNTNSGDVRGRACSASCTIRG